MSDPSKTTDPSRARKAGTARTLLAVAAPMTAFGIALAALGDAEMGRWLVVAGGFGLILGLHRYGRLGADPPAELE